MANPFKPTAGAVPPLLVGRDALLAEVDEGIRAGAGHPARITIFTGARGTGKTVMLTEAGDRAMAHGWLVIDESASPGMLARIGEAVDRLLDGVNPRARRRITGMSIGGVGSVETELTPRLAEGVRHRIGRLLDTLEKDGTGLLVTVDEVHARSDDLRELALITQHLVREDREFAIVMAGLPSAVSDLLRSDAQGRVLTFLRRADKHVLADVEVDEVHDALVQTVTDNGRTIDEDAARAAAEATHGYPFLIQLVGFHVWRAAAGDRITRADVAAGVDAARERLGTLVTETALADLSPRDLDVLRAMAADDGPSRMVDLAARTGMARQNADTYRRRLLDAGVIVQAGRGQVDFALPYLREHLRARM
ncbi:ATP-binding protein [Demequina sp. SYSU T00192]|uniref:ATP-binding protein n=1 Tax=Demequina litoralis TaxID=3051660 RepID=A0ABT8G5M7_9MICO|nr:ATP-binding protein [Demequina sp. SYSU T00192]MDN4474433.1 ATP-binding protein [Demequina sp. SYSU T00192]